MLCKKSSSQEQHDINRPKNIQIFTQQQMKTENNLKTKTPRKIRVNQWIQEPTS